MYNLYGKYSEKRLSEMDTADLVELCKIKPDVAIYLLENKPELFGGYNEELLKKSLMLNVRENIRFYKGFYLSELRDVNEEVKQIIDRSFKNKIHPDYIHEPEQHKRCVLI